MCVQAARSVAKWVLTSCPQVKLGMLICQLYNLCTPMYIALLVRQRGVFTAGYTKQCVLG